MLETDGLQFLTLNDARGGRRWIRLDYAEVVSTFNDALTIAVCVREKRHRPDSVWGCSLNPYGRLVKQYRGQRVVDQERRLDHHRTLRSTRMAIGNPANGERQSIVQKSLGHDPPRSVGSGVDAHHSGSDGRSGQSGDAVFSGKRFLSDVAPGP